MPSRGVSGEWGHFTSWHPCETQKLRYARGIMTLMAQNIPVTATPVFRSGSTDIALPMAQRLGECDTATATRSSSSCDSDKS
jgi:hypothetical protein